MRSRPSKHCCSFLYRLLPVLFSLTAIAQNNTIVLLNSDSSNTNRPHWFFRQTGTPQWLSATVPGAVHTDLLANKRIPDPFYNTNEDSVQWVEKAGWEYHAVIKADAALLENTHAELVWEGLDTYATVYLNDSLILKADNMFRTWRVEVRQWLKVGNNDLHVVFESAVNKGKELSKQLPYALPEGERIFTRKAQYQYGWDWGPRLVTAGIWRSVKLEAWNTCKISGLHVFTDTVTSATAHLHAEAGIRSGKDDTLYYTFSGTTGLQTIPGNEKNARRYAIALHKGYNTLTIPFVVHKPKRWWCNGLGKADLYKASIVIYDKHGRRLAEDSTGYGIRTIQWVQQPDSAGKSFYLKLNGVPVFCKGANYIPPDNFMPRITEDRYKQLLSGAKDAHMNMLRVWGGGVYEDDRFYNMCDSLGIMVWQDFMFAGAMYPGDAAFLNNVRHEVEDNVNRLCGHPSIVLWCGNNEISEAWHNWGWQKQYHYNISDSAKLWNDYQMLFYQLIPQTLTASTKNNTPFYWPSSPAIGWGHKESMQQGDSHYWGVWWGMEPFEIYNTKTGRFMSEYGFQGIPAISTLQKVLQYSALHLGSVALNHHQKHPAGWQTIQIYMERDYKVPANFEDYVYVSQLLQAKGVTTAIEAHRRNRPYCMGTLYWQLNDCWPVTSWSSTDYYNTPKALHYAVSEAYRTFLISVEQDARGYFVHVISDSLKPVKAMLVLSLITFDGKLLKQQYIPVKMAENTSRVAFFITRNNLLSNVDSTQVFWKMQLKVSGQTLAGKYYYFAKPKQLKLPAAIVKRELIQSNGHTYVVLKTDKLAKNIYLQYNNVRFSDNFFDLPPGESRWIKAEGLTDINKLEIKTLNHIQP